MLHNNTTEIPNNFNQEHINYFSRISLKNLMLKFNLIEEYVQSILSINNDKQEFGIYSVYSLQKNIAKDIIQDDITSASIKKYLNLIDVEREKKKKGINKLYKNKEPLIIWGCGAFTSNLLATTNLGKCNIKHFVNNNPIKVGKYIDKFKIEKPNKEILLNKTIVICSMLYSNQIVEQIESMDINSNIVIL